MANERGLISQHIQQEPNPVVDFGDAANSIFGLLDGLDENIPRSIPLDKVVTDDDIQVRVNGLDRENLERLRGVLDGGGTLDPIKVYLVDGQYMVVDGFHRVALYRERGETQIEALVFEGKSYTDALNDAEEANLKHGKYLSNADKKNMLFRRLGRGHEWTGLSDREIARQLGIGKDTVRRWWEEYNSTGAFAPVTRETRTGSDGRTYNTERIRQANQAREDVPPAAPVEPMPTTPAEQRRQIAFLVERLEKLDVRMEAAVKARDVERVAELEEYRGNIVEHLERVKGVKFSPAILTPSPSPMNGEGRHLSESDPGKALRVIREMDGLLDTLVELLNASGGDWEESGQADVLRNFRGFVNGCGELLGNMKKVWG